MKKVFTLLTALLVTTACCNMLIACGSDDDDNGGSGSNAVDVSGLIGQEYLMQENEIVSIRNYVVGFLSPYFCYVHKYGRDLDAGATETGGWDRWDHGEKELMYRVSGNTIIIPYEHEGVESNIVLNIVNGQPEGWQHEGTVERKWTVSKERFDAKSGTSDMFGYYSQDNVRKFSEQAANDMVASGNYVRRNWESAFTGYSYSGGSLRIVDGNTIDRVDEVVAIEKPKNEPIYVYQTQQYSPKSNIGSATYTLYYFFCTDYYVSRHKYVMNGNTLVLSSGEKLIYENGTLRYDNNNASYTIMFTKF